MRKPELLEKKILPIFVVYSPLPRRGDTVEEKPRTELQKKKIRRIGSLPPPLLLFSLFFLNESVPPKWGQSQKKEGGRELSLSTVSPIFALSSYTI